MKLAKIIAYVFTILKLLVAVPVLVIGVLVPYASIRSDGLNSESLLSSLGGLLIILSAIGVGYPFLLIRTKGIVAWMIIAFSAVPLCVALSNPAFGLLKLVAYPWMIFALVDFILSKRIRDTAWSLRKCAFVLGCGVLAEIGVMGVDAILSRGRSYQSPAIAFQGESKDLQQSLVVPTLDTPMPKGKNIVWCGTIQLSWNRLGKDVLHQPPQVQGAEAVVSRLNGAQLEEGDLPPNSYFATAGLVKDGVLKTVKSEMKQRFQKEVEIDAMEPNEILAYAYLEANAPFTIPFFDNRKAFHFRDSSGKETEVTSFGIEEKHEYAYWTLREQIEVLYLHRNGDREPDEFVIDLCRDSSPNQIVVACVPSKPTLLEMLTDVEKKTKEWAAKESGSRHRGEFGIRDVLLVPNLNWLQPLDRIRLRSFRIAPGVLCMGKVYVVPFGFDRRGTHPSPR